MLGRRVRFSHPQHVVNATVACFVSHVRLLEEVWRNGSHGGPPLALILEDDVVVPRNLLERLSQVQECAPANWTVLKVSSWGATREKDLVRRAPCKLRTRKEWRNGLLFASCC